MDDRARDFWAAYWTDRRPTIAAPTMSRVMDRIKLERLRPLLPAQGRTLEVGCGAGRLSCYLAQLGYRTACLDFCPSALLRAQGNFTAANALGWFVTGEATQLPLLDQQFDVVLSTGLLEHFADPAPIVHEMTRVLKAGGLFYSDIVPRKFSLFRSLDWIGRLKRAMLDRSAPAAALYERRLAPPDIRRLLRSAGLVDVSVVPAGVVPPYLPVLYRVRGLREFQVRLVEKTQRIWSRFDGTRVAGWIGFYYFVWARKPKGPVGMTTPPLHRREV
jgi:SAM-dependent methyltransferase